IHHALAAAAAEGIEALVSATEAAQWVEASASQLDGYARSSLPDALLVMRSQHDDLRQTLATISRHLTGERWPASLAAHAIALDRLLTQLAEPEVGHDDAQIARERAARAWTGTE
ncbi:MAG: hypothetical protein DYH12_21815, partial [Sorangiineae bacterium PRO1]|nr:hypothetical protein [Sorangiineae bacterium PRO1]